MAKSITITSGSLFCGNPIMVSIGAENFQGKASFHRVKLEVSVALIGVSSDYETHTLSSPASDDEVVQIDISSVLRSMAELFEYSFLTGDKTYPYIKYTMKAYDEYMMDGILYPRVAERAYGGTLTALIGAFTDMERYISGVSKPVQRFSRKPGVGEVCAASETLLYPTPLPEPAGISMGVTAGPTVKAYSLAGLLGAVTYAGHIIYVIPDSPDRFAFQFVNSLGVVESISAECLVNVEVEKTMEPYIVSAPGSFNRFRRNIIRKLTDRRTMNMSSGPVNELWADWWMHEFLNAEQSWIWLDGYWVPCSITSGEKVAGIDRTKNVFPEVLFSVKLDMDGSTKNLI